MSNAYIAMELLEFQNWEQGEPQFLDHTVFSLSFQAAIQADGHFMKIIFMVQCSMKEL